MRAHRRAAQQAVMTELMLLVIAQDRGLGGAEGRHHALPLPVRNVLIREREIDVLAHCEIVQQVITLKHHANVLLRKLSTLFALHFVDRFLAKPIFAIPGVIEQCEDI